MGGGETQHFHSIYTFNLLVLNFPLSGKKCTKLITVGKRVVPFVTETVEMTYFSIFATQYQCH